MAPSITDDVIKSYLDDKLPLQSSHTVHSPYTPGSFMASHHDTIVDGIKITRFKMIKSLVSHKLIPVEKSTVYKLESMFTMGVVPFETSWTELSQRGRKSLLTHLPATLHFRDSLFDLHRWCRSSNFERSKCCNSSN